MDLSRLPDDCNGLGTPAGLVSIACIHEDHVTWIWACGGVFMVKKNCDCVTSRKVSS